VLLLTWSLSPIGGQSSLRALDVRPNITSSEYPLISYPKNDLSTFVGMVAMEPTNKTIFETPFPSKYRMLVSATFAAQDMSLMQADESSREYTNALAGFGGFAESAKLMQRDLWRNVRVPFIHTLPGYRNEETDWISVPSDTIPRYSSFIGVPIRGFPSREEANTTFNIQTSYQTLNVGLFPK
jgi:hypothetical protein